MAADLRRELALEVRTAPGRYGEFTVLVDGEEVCSGGAFAFLGVLPSRQQVRQLVAEHLHRAAERSRGMPPTRDP